jgi:hypothetical protein
MSEADWKRLRRLQPIALDRFCQQVLAEVVRLAGDPAEGSHARYLALSRLLQARDEELAHRMVVTERSASVIASEEVRGPPSSSEVCRLLHEESRYAC